MPAARWRHHKWPRRDGDRAPAPLFRCDAASTIPTMSPETLAKSKPSRYPAQHEKIPCRRHATRPSPGGGGKRMVWWGLGLEGAGVIGHSFLCLKPNNLQFKLGFSPIESYKSCNAMQVEIHFLLGSNLSVSECFKYVGPSFLFSLRKKGLVEVDIRTSRVVHFHSDRSR
jgi:hypothetical protein